MLKRELQLKQLNNRLQKVRNTKLGLVTVLRPYLSIFQRQEKVIVMRIPKRYTLNDVHEIIMGIWDVYPHFEDLVHTKGEYFMCYRVDVAHTLALAGFLYKKKRRRALYQLWPSSNQVAA